MLSFSARVKRKLLWLKDRAVERRWRRRYKAVADQNTRTLSFDAFDTLITRTWFSPSDLFRAVGLTLRREGLFRGSVDEWWQLRIDAETMARNADGVEEVTLEDIYCVIQGRVGWSPGETRQAIEIEFQQELTSIRPIATALFQQAQLSQERKDIVVASDTYFSSDQLQQLLVRAGFDLSPEGLFASSSHGATKQTGSLFRKILREKGLQPHELWHTGDNPLSDGYSPARIGVRSAISADSLPTRYEVALSGKPGEEAFICSALSGCARTSRLSRSLASDAHQVIWNTGSNVVGPLLFAYVLWVLVSARSQKFERLYFLARDGEVMFLIAKQIAEWLNWPIDCRYLYTSRQSFSLPSISEVDDAALAWILKWPKVSSVRSVLSRVGLTTDDVSEQLEAAGFCGADLSRPLDARDVEMLRRVLTSPAVRDRILTEAANRRAVLLDYLRQEGLEDDVRSALCDVGWRGSIQQSLSAVRDFGLETASPLKGFYFGLDKGDLLIDEAQAEAFIDGDISRYVWMVEAFCAAESGSVDHFERYAGGVRPVLKAAYDPVHVDWGAGIQREAVLKFVSELISTIDPRDIEPSHLLKVATVRSWAAFEMFLNHPDRKEASVYGSLRASAVPTHDSMIPGAPELDIGRLLLWSALRERCGVPWISWPEGAIRRSERWSAIGWAARTIYKSRSGIQRLREKLR